MYLVASNACLAWYRFPSTNSVSAPCRPGSPPERPVARACPWSVTPVSSVTFNLSQRTCPATSFGYILCAAIRCSAHRLNWC